MSLYTESSRRRSRAAWLYRSSWSRRSFTGGRWKRSFPGRNQRFTYAGRFSIPQIVNNTSPSSREISRLGLALPCEYSRIPRGVSEPVYEGTAPWIYYSMGANVIWRRSGRVSRASALIAREDKRAPLVIQLARYCPMILDRPPIHRFNAVEHVPRVRTPALRWRLRRDTMTNDAWDDRSLPA